MLPFPLKGREIGRFFLFRGKEIAIFLPSQGGGQEGDGV
jgi:hypothetical protein